MLTKCCLNCQIKKQLNDERNGYKYRSELVPESTSLKYLSKVSTLQISIMHGSVSNKTQPRRAAALSIRSSVAYMMTVITTYFIGAKISKYHIPNQILVKIPTYQLIKVVNSIMLGIDPNNASTILEFLPILKHLITSTDECTIFMSNGIIGKHIDGIL